jgi:hypothetical protein
MLVNGLEFGIVFTEHVEFVIVCSLLVVERGEKGDDVRSDGRERENGLVEDTGFKPDCFGGVKLGELGCDAR